MFDRDHIIVSAEGIRKTHVLFDLMEAEALDTAVKARDQVRRFHCFAFRSADQAAEKAHEYQTSNGNRRAVVLKPFWKRYEDACRKRGKAVIQRECFEEETDIVSVLRKISQEQPDVYNELEYFRRAFWTNAGDQLFNGVTMLFTTHATVMNWNKTHLNRIWHHPEFDPGATRQDDLNRLRTEFAMEKIVFDEPEPDEFVYILPAAMFEHLSAAWKSPWRNLPTRERRTYSSACGIIAKFHQASITSRSTMTYAELIPMDSRKSKSISTAHYLDVKTRKPGKKGATGLATLPLLCT
jgi:hypothetical protein